MKLNREEFKTVIERCARIAPSRDAGNKQLQHAAVIFDGKVVTCLATSLGLSYRGTLTANGEPLAFTAPAKDLVATLACLEGDVVTVTRKANEITLKGSGPRKFRRRVQDVETFPRVDEPGPESSEVDAKVFCEAISKVVFATAPETDDRVHLKAVELSFGASTVSASATDGRRIAHATLAHEGSAEKRYIISAPAARELLQIVDEDPIHFHEARTHTWAVSGHHAIRYPEIPNFSPVEQFVGLPLPYSLEVDAKQLLGALSALRRVDRDGGVILAFKDGLVIESYGDGFGRDEVECEVENPVTLEVTGQYIAEPLTAWGVDRVIIEYQGELDPLRVRADGFQSIIMPLMRGSVRARSVA